MSAGPPTTLAAPTPQRLAAARAAPPFVPAQKNQIGPKPATKLSVTAPAYEPPSESEAGGSQQSPTPRSTASGTGSSEPKPALSASAPAYQPSSSSAASARREGPAEETQAISAVRDASGASDRLVHTDSMPAKAVSAAQSAISPKADAGSARAEQLPLRAASLDSDATSKQAWWPEASMKPAASATAESSLESSTAAPDLVVPEEGHPMLLQPAVKIQLLEPTSPAQQQAGSAAEAEPKQGLRPALTPAAANEVHQSSKTDDPAVDDLAADKAEESAVVDTPTKIAANGGQQQPAAVEVMAAPGSPQQEAPESPVSPVVTEGEGRMLSFGDFSPCAVKTVTTPGFPPEAPTQLHGQSAAQPSEGLIFGSSIPAPQKTSHAKSPSPKRAAKGGRKQAPQRTASPAVPNDRDDRTHGKRHKPNKFSSPETDVAPEVSAESTLPAKQLQPVQPVSSDEALTQPPSKPERSTKNTAEGMASETALSSPEPIKETQINTAPALDAATELSENVSTAAATTGAVEAPNDPAGTLTTDGSESIKARRPLSAS